MVNKLLAVLRFGYFLVILCMVIIIWISLSGAMLSPASGNAGRLHYALRNPPCYFNSLCSCSRADSDLGVVQCVQVAMSRIPPPINNSKVYTLRMNQNGLRYLDPFFFQSTGLYGLEISGNFIYEIPDKAFIGLERSLRELKLQNNLLIRVPSRALRHLQKLHTLDLSGNDIISIKNDHFRGLENSLETLILSNNDISSLPVHTFTGLPMLKVLDLTGNNLKEIDPSIFSKGMEKLTYLILADNLLEMIPYEALAPLSSLKSLDLQRNRITAVNVIQVVPQRNMQISLDVLRLDFNQITHLPTLSFQHFDFLNKTYFNGNPLSLIEEDAFQPAKIRELYLHDCDLTHVSPAAFGGLENSLQILDLSGNNLSSLPHNIFNTFNYLQTLSIKDNRILAIQSQEIFQKLRYLDLSGVNNAPLALQSLRTLKNLRSLTLTKLSKSQLDPDDFSEFGVDLEELKIIRGNLKTIKAHAFQHIKGIKKLDLSENRIQKIEKDAFLEIGHNLLSLHIAHGFATSFNQLPPNVLTPLTNIQHLDLSNNNLVTISDTCLHFLKQIKRLELQNNKINQLLKGTFQGDLHSNLEEIYLSFNNIKVIEQHTFVDLLSAEYIYLDDNQIERLERKSFMNLNQLKLLNLRGNKISSIAGEAFQNLPELDFLDLAYNSMKFFDFSIFDQVGTLGMLKVNISHNKIRDLPFDGMSGKENGLGDVHSNIKTLDLSYNNISHIGRSFFRPIELSLNHLHLSNNALLNASWDVFGNMPHLQWLDLSTNRIQQISFDAFKNTRHLQVLLCSHNKLENLNSEIFRSMTNLRVIDLSYNKINFLPDSLFFGEGLEKLDLSHNYLIRVPLASLSFGSGLTLCELDVSNNNIPSIIHKNFYSRFKLLRILDLSKNKITKLDNGIFNGLLSLTHLDLSHNTKLVLENDGSSFEGIEDTLWHLGLENMSFTSIPSLPFQNLQSLSLANNMLATIPQQLAHNLSKVRYLNLAHNDLTAVPVMLNSLPRLRELSLAFNPISHFTNYSLERIASELTTLDIRGLKLLELETNALDKMSALRTLKISEIGLPDTFNIPELLDETKTLQNLQIQVDSETTLSSEMEGLLPTKLKNITFSGTGLRAISNHALQGIRSPTLHVDFSNTSITFLGREFFQNVGTARNISLDVTGNYFKTLENPSTGNMPDLPGKTFLVQLNLKDNSWTCNCDIGWIEVWLRKRRQYLCEDDFVDSTDYDSCLFTDDDLREAVCVNKGNNSLLEVLKTDIECGWSRGTNTDFTHSLIFLFAIIVYLTT